MEIFRDECGARFHWGKAGWPYLFPCFDGKKHYPETWCDFGCAVGVSLPPLLDLKAVLVCAPPLRRCAYVCVCVHVLVVCTFCAVSFPRPNVRRAPAFTLRGSARKLSSGLAHIKPKSVLLCNAEHWYIGNPSPDEFHLSYASTIKLWVKWYQLDPSVCAHPTNATVSPQLTSGTT
jgi:hypothetical protein